MDRIAVQLLQYYSGVNAGEIAGYMPEVAARLIEQGFARAYVPQDQADLVAADAPSVQSGKGGKAVLPAQGADA